MKSTKSPSPSSRERARGQAEVEYLRQKISELVRNSPQKAAMILTQWMNKAASHGKKAG